MKTLNELVPGTIVTVRKVTGGREIRTSLERLGIMAGSDLTILKTSEEGVLVRTDRREVTLGPEEVEHIAIGAHFTRDGDPILLGGCCACGNTGDLLDRMERLYKEEENHE